MSIDAPTTTLGAAMKEFASVGKKLWYLTLLRGVLAIVFGIVAMSIPHSVAGSLAIIVGIFAIIEGVLEIIEAIRHRAIGGMALHAFTGLLTIVFGVIVLSWPAITLLVFVYTVAFWSLTHGILQVILAVTVKGASGGARVWGVIAGAISFIFGVLLLTQPAAGLAAIVWIVGIWAVVGGLALIALAFMVRKAARELAAIPE